MQEQFFMPFGYASGQLVTYLKDWEIDNYEDIHSYAGYNRNHLYVTRTYGIPPKGDRPKHHIAFYAIACDEPDYQLDKKTEIYRIIHPLQVDDIDNLEPFGARFQYPNEVYYVPMNQDFFKFPDWQGWMLELINWVNIYRKSIIVHATETIPQLYYLSLLHYVPNVHVYQTHTSWRVLRGILDGFTD